MAETTIPTVITYADVEKAVGKENALDVYRQIARIAGGDDNPNHDGGLSLDEKGIAEVAKLIEKTVAEANAAAEKAKGKK